MPYLFLLFLGVVSVFAVEQEQPTPYDLIRPVFPMVWDTIPTDEGGTVESFSSFEPNKTKRNPVPKVGSVPQDFVPNGYVPDTLNQAFLDARNLRIGRIRINQAGYLPEDGEKHFYYVSNDKECADKYDVVDLNGNLVAGDGKFRSTGHTTESSWTIVAATDAASNNQNRYKAKAEGPTGTVCEGFLSEMSLPTEVRLRVRVGKEYSSTFIISERVYSMVRDATIKFYGINRSGNSESWFHKPSHTKDGGAKYMLGSTAAAGDLPTPFDGAVQGGWYDCGDHLKESQTMAYAFMVLSIMAASNPDRDDDNYAYNHGETQNTDGIPDILREAKHGADFFLRSFAFAEGIVDNMVVSVGNFGADHGWWGRPENQDALPTSVVGRGGPHERDLRLGELGSNISGQIAAGLAILSKDYAQYDKDFADSCLMVAEKMYDFAKNLKLKEKNLGPGTYDGGKKYVYNTVADGWSSPAYNGNNESHDDLAMAAIALHYATYEKTGSMDYLNDAAEDKTIGVEQESTTGFFKGGWMAWSRDGMRKSSKNTSWANAYTYTLYGFYKILLRDSETAAKYGITEDKRLEYVETVAYTLSTNLGSMAGSGSGSITLPGLFNDFNLSYGDLWYNMQTDQTWIYNRYQAGNIFEVFAYADVTKDLEGVKLPGKGIRQWHSAELKQLGINQLNYMLGVNPWDVSFLLGIGDKNDAHPHHRASNPEGKNMPGSAYKYTPPVGALFGGVTPSASGANDWAPSNRSWEDYHLSETCIDGTAMFLAAGALSVKEEDRNRAPSEINVEIRYAGFDSAIVNINQDVRGTVMILASKNETGPFVDMYVDSVPGVKHTVIMRGLENGTTYYFKVVGINARSEKYVTKWLVDSTSTPFYFTTLASEAPDANIQNVKVCNLSADSAEIMWYTPNGQYESKIYWDTVLTTYDKMANNSGLENADVSGIPTSFHYVKIGGLKEKTTYYYVVESNGVRRSTDDNGQPLKFTTPVEQFNFEVRTYQYVFGNMDFMNMNIFNNEERAFDSLTLRLYLTATEAEVEKCALMIDSDICQAYDEAGFNKPCENDREIRDNLRGAMPVRLDDTYNAATNEYAWYYPIPLGSTTIKSSSRMRIDLGFSVGLFQNDKCDPLRSTPKKRFTNGSEDYVNTHDWSWRPHSQKDGDRVDYDGMPTLDKDFGDADLAPVDPYIVVYRKDEFVWGYSPSYKEMTNKRANYKMTVTLEKPFNVNNGSYVEIDSSASTMHVRGTALITEGGYVNSIWVNGVALAPEVVKTAAVFNYETQKYDLDIPVKLKIGTNKVDVTIFAGPDPECDACQENGGCAFVNRSWFIQFSKGNATAGILTLLTQDGKSVSSPALTDGSLKFYINVKDKDKKDMKSLTVKVANSRTGDTTEITLNSVNAAIGEFQSDLLTAVADKNASGKNIAFFGGDTISVIYVDPDDEEDLSTQSFFADPTHPIPQVANVSGDDCDAKITTLTATFNSQFDQKIVLDSAVISFDATETDLQKTVTVLPNGGKVTSGGTATFDIASVAPATAGPSGSVTFYMTESGVVTNEKIELSDAMAPALVKVLLLENSDPRVPEDTVKLVFSEPVILANTGEWPLYVGDGASEVDQSGISVQQAWTEDNGKSWIYAVVGNTEGKLIVGKNDEHPGYMASIKGGFSVTDLAFNEIATCEAVEIVEAVKAIHVNYARITDKEGDGQPDEIFLRFESEVDAKHEPDSLLVYWGSPAVYQSFAKPAGGWKMETVDNGVTYDTLYSKVDSSLVEVKKVKYDSLTGETKSECASYKTEKVCASDSVVSKTDTTKLVCNDTLKEVDVKDSSGQKICLSYKDVEVTVKAEKLDTVWDYTLGVVGIDSVVKKYSTISLPVENGVYAKATYGANNGKGLLMQGGSFFDVDSAALSDDCPPIIISAEWRSKTTGSIEMDYLDIVMSEPLSPAVDTVNESEFYYVERLRDGLKGKYLKQSSLKAKPNTASNYKKVTFRYLFEADSVVWSGDSIRLIPDSTKSFFKDMANLFPREANPWVPVTGVIEKLKFSVKPLVTVAKKSPDSTYYGNLPPVPGEHFRLTVDAGDGSEYIVASGKRKLERVGRMASGYKHAGPTFKIEVQLPDGLSRDELTGELLYEYMLTFNFQIFSNLGGFSNEMSYTVNLAKENLVGYISANSIITFYLEWVSPGAAPTSLDDRLIGSGAYIGKFDFSGRGIDANGRSDSQHKGSKTKTISFGFRR